VAFNEEKTARAIAACKKPVVSAVGHETDFTIADFVADLRAPTPSAAAELCVPEKESLQHGLAMAADRLEELLRMRIQQRRLHLSGLQKRLETLSPAQKRERMRAAFKTVGMRMDNAAVKAVADNRNRQEKAFSRVEMLASSAVTSLSGRLEKASLRLHASGPMETMKRGYAIVSRKGQLVRSAQTLRQGDQLTVRFADGRAQTVVESAEQEG